MSIPISQFIPPLPAFPPGGRIMVLWESKLVQFGGPTLGKIIQKESTFANAI